MFKKLKSQLQEAVNNAASLTVTNHNNNQESDAASQSGRSRKNSYSSVASDSAQSSFLFGNYATPQRKYYPPSDVESDLDASSSVTSDWSNDQLSPGSTNSEIKKLNKLLDIYKNKFNQLKNAYAEVESEKEKIKVSRSNLKVTRMNKTLLLTIDSVLGIAVIYLYSVYSSVNTVLEPFSQCFNRKYYLIKFN